MSGFAGFNSYNDGTGYGNYNGTSAGGGGGGFSSQGDSSKPRQNNNQTITPVTIRTIQTATQTSQDGPFEAFGIPLAYVSFIGKIRDIDTANSSSTVYKVEDGTDAITVRHWNEDGELQDEPPFTVGEYVKVCATVREFTGKKQLQTQSIRKIEDFNEVPYHYLSAIKTYVDHKQPEAAGGNSTLFVDANGSQNNASTTDGPISERLYHFIKENSKSMAAGVPTQLMAQEFGISVSQVVDHLNPLIDEGRIFATDEESLFLCV